MLPPWAVVMVWIFGHSGSRLLFFTSSITA
jgi:hypothetical protein